MKKFIVIPFGYEYNDNTYDREGFQFEDARHFDTAKEANVERLKLTQERIPELNSNYDSVLYCMGDEGATKVADYLEVNRYDYELELSELTDEQVKKVLEMIAPYVYEIIEIDTEKDCSKIVFDGDEYSTESYSVKLNENNEVVLHSITEPAYEKVYKETYSSWMPNEDNEEEMEYYRKYYINGEKMTQSEWRESKIDSVIENEA